MKEKSISIYSGSQVIDCLTGIDPQLPKSTKRFTEQEKESTITFGGISRWNQPTKITCTATYKRKYRKKLFFTIGDKSFTLEPEVDISDQFEKGKEYQFIFE